MAGKRKHQREEPGLRNRVQTPYRIRGACGVRCPEGPLSRRTPRQANAPVHCDVRHCPTHSAGSGRRSPYAGASVGSLCRHSRSVWSAVPRGTALPVDTAASQRTRALRFWPRPPPRTAPARAGAVHTRGELYGVAAIGKKAAGEAIPSTLGHGGSCRRSRLLQHGVEGVQVVPCFLVGRIEAEDLLELAPGRAGPALADQSHPQV